MEITNTDGKPLWAPVPDWAKDILMDIRDIINRLHDSSVATPNPRLSPMEMAALRDSALRLNKMLAR